MLFYVNNDGILYVPIQWIAFHNYNRHCHTSHTTTSISAQVGHSCEAYQFTSSKYTSK